MRILKAAMIAITILLLGSFHNKSSAQVSANISFQTFYDELSPYGQWIDYPDYGYVWRPDNYRYRDFHPYRSDGHWAWSQDYGWLWVSDYDWGWAPFHYGRWIYDDWDGWLWVPDYEWGPAWVVWRGGGDYYGWAPMRPGIHINLNFGRYDLPYNYWSFAPRRYINYPRISNYCMGYDRNTYIFNQTTIINNYNRQRSYFTGPSRYEAERYTRINPVRLRESQRAGRTIIDRDEVSIYRPYINRGRDHTSPRNFERYDQRMQNRTFDRRNNSGTIRENNFPNNGTSGNTERQDRNDRPYMNRGHDRNNSTIERRNIPSQENRRIENRNSATERQSIPGPNNDRNYRNRRDQYTERQPFPDRDDQRADRQQVPQRNEQRIERPYQDRGNQRIERQQTPGTNNQRVERQQMPNSQRAERQTVPNQNSQRAERSYQNRGQQQPQVQRQSDQRGNGNGNENGNGRKRGND